MRLAGGAMWLAILEFQAIAIKGKGVASRKDNLGLCIHSNNSATAKTIFNDHFKKVRIFQVSVRQPQGTPPRRDSFTHTSHLENGEGCGEKRRGYVERGYATAAGSLAVIAVG